MLETGTIFISSFVLLLIIVDKFVLIVPLFLLQLLQLFSYHLFLFSSIWMILNAIFLKGDALPCL